MGGSDINGCVITDPRYLPALELGCPSALHSQSSAILQVTLTVTLTLACMVVRPLKLNKRPITSEKELEKGVRAGCNPASNFQGLFRKPRFSVSSEQQGLWSATLTSYG